MSERHVRTVAIVNPAAGGGPDAALQVLRDHPGIDLRVVHTTGPGDGTRLVTEQMGERWAQVVVAVGGDGTVAQVASGLHAHPGAPLLVAPAGTGNSNYRGLCDDLEWAEIVEALAAGTLQRRTIDLAIISEVDRIVLLGTTTGLLPATLEVARTIPGSGRDLLSEATSLTLQSHRSFPVRVRIDGELVHDGDLFGTYIGGMRHRGGRFEMLPDSLIDDGQLDVCLMSTTVAPLYGRGSTISIERTDGAPLLVELDGELERIESSTCTVRVLPAALEVLVPEPLPAAFGARIPATATTTEAAV
jgi:diacylglycerol kinase (ATP)